jgi:hypothetical protein
MTLPALVVLLCSTPAFCGEIHDAARDGDLAKVKALLKENPALVFSRDRDGETPLHWAAGKGHTDVAELLLSSKAEVDAKDSDGETPLFWAVRMAVRMHRKDMVELLLANGADVNVKTTRYKITPLSLADKDVAQLLMEHGARQVKARRGALPQPPHPPPRPSYPEPVLDPGSEGVAGGESRVYIWRATSTAGYERRWSIRGVLGRAGLPGHGPIPGVQRQLGLPVPVYGPYEVSPPLSLIQAISADESLASNFEEPWAIAPGNTDDEFSLESGSAMIHISLRDLTLRGPIRFRSEARIGVFDWSAPDGYGGYICIRPFLWPASSGSLFLGADVVASGTEGLAQMWSKPVNVSGTIRFPDYKWTEAKRGFVIKGGGLQFDETGVFLIPGTLYAEKAGGTAPGVPSPPTLSGSAASAQSSSSSAPTLFAKTLGAVEDGDLEKIEAALKGKPDLVFNKDRAGMTLLHWAAFWGQEKVVEQLLANKAEVNAKSNDGRTPLYYAESFGYKDVADLLRQYGGHE